MECVMGAVDEILRGCLAEATRDFIGIWEIIADIKALPLDELQGSIKDRTMFIVNILLDFGFVAVDLSCSGGCGLAGSIKRLRESPHRNGVVPTWPRA
jgi:hypothetical protein